MNDTKGLRTRSDSFSKTRQQTILHRLAVGLLDERVQPVLVIIVYLMIMVHCFFSESAIRTVIIIICNVLGFLLNILLLVPCKGINKVTCENLDLSTETKRLVGTMVLLSVRFMALSSNRVILLPLCIMLVTSANRLHQRHALWGVSASFFTLTHYMVSAVVNGFNLVQNHGDLKELMNALTLDVSIVIGLMMYTYHLFSIIGELQQQVSKLEKTRSQLESAVSARDNFISHVSHEFRCPIMSSIGCLELLKETSLDDQQTELVDTIISSNSVLLVLIEDILQLVKVEFEKKQGNLHSNNQSFCLGQCLIALKKIVFGYANQFSVKLDFFIDEKVQNLHVLSNRSLLHQLFSNLLTNAVKASKRDGRVELHCSLHEPVDGKIHSVMFKVKDYGCGIPKSKIDDIFEPFVQLHNVNESVVPSSGLGLTTVATIVSSLGGTITVESEVGKGTEFTVILPLMTVQDKSLDTSSNLDDDETQIKLQMITQQNYIKLLSETGKSSSGSNLVQQQEAPKSTKDDNAPIIVAEDNPINRKVILNLIQSLGFSADSVSDGLELLERFKPDCHKVVISDLNMPNKNGLEAAKELRMRYGDNIKIFILTGNVLMNDEAELSDIVDDILTKPCTKQTLKNCFKCLAE